ncbi:hypothetical protein [Flammeovirga sp. SJP92]|uniref:hypothetical protein n=1 Tax=Flammeovirga sp. SJP92 TaxID=1775430 RepID=UPI0007895A26|nr:hypothetical protein [Flammeovirga sp. SJP92]KXX68663.1 hypothetical protein AVL50_23175 [Flammeovirga sp. SJP92]
MKNLSIIILSILSVQLFSCSNNDNNETPNNSPSVSIENQQDILEVYPLQEIQLDVLAKTNSDKPISDLETTGDGSCIQAQDTTLNQNEGYLNYRQSAPYSKGDYTITFTAYTDDGKTSNVEQKIKVVAEPFIMEIDSTKVPSSATEGDKFTVTGTFKSVLPYNGTTTSVDIPGQTGIQFKTSVLEAGFDAVVDNTPATLPHSNRIGFEVKEHNLEKDSNGYYVYNFNVEYTVSRPGDNSELPQNEFTISIIYNYYNSTIGCTENSTPMFGTWSKTVTIQ